MFSVKLTKITENETTVWAGWFTTAEVKKNLKNWAADYDAVTIQSAQVSVLEVAQVQPHETK